MAAFAGAADAARTKLLYLTCVHCHFLKLSLFNVKENNVEGIILSVVVKKMQICEIMNHSNGKLKAYLTHYIHYPAIYTL